MYKIKTNKMIIFYFFHFIFFGIFISLCHIFLKTKQNKNTNKQTKSRTSSWPILAQTDRYYQCPKLNTFIVWTYFGCFRCCFVILYFVQFCFCLFCFCLFFRKKLFAAVDASPTPPRWGRRPKTWGTEMWIPEDPFSRTEERLRKTRQRVSLSYFYSLKICFKFIRFCTLCLLACRTISEQFIFFFIFKVLSIHFQNSFILIFCHRPIILYLINFYKNSLS